MNTSHVYIQLCQSGAQLPIYASLEAAGADLHACLAEPISLAPLARALVPTGLRLQLESGFEGQVRPRSGLALKHGITVLNAPGTIDADYRGELGVILINLGSETFTINHGDRIAQLVISPVIQGNFELSTSLTSSARGEGGFGSTGF
ncbi:dUTP diphosphatase [Treponema sp.]